MTRKKFYIIDILTASILFFTTSFFFMQMDQYIDQGLPAIIDPILFPKVIALSLMIFTFVYLLGSLYRGYRLIGSPAQMTEQVFIEQDAEEPESNVGFYAYIAVLLGYYLAFEPIGFVLSTPIAMMVIAKMLGNRKMIVSFVAYVLFTLCIYYLFLKAMQLSLPIGKFPL